MLNTIEHKLIESTRNHERNAAMQDLEIWKKRQIIVEKNNG